MASSKDSRFSAIPHHTVTVDGSQSSVRVDPRLKVLKNNHPVYVFADNSVWDSVDNKFVEYGETNVKGK